MDIPNCFYRVSIKALILDKTRAKFLLFQEADGRWELPGGGLDWGEDPREALRREIHEETGLETTWISDRSSYFITSKQDKGEAWIANILYETRLRDLTFVPSEECVAVRFFSPDEARAMDLFTSVKKFIEIFNADGERK